MRTLPSQLAARLPVRIDISWLKGHDRADAASGDLAEAEQSPERSALMGRILELNPSADPAFLAQFAPGALDEYLAHLVSASMPRGRTARRIRPENTPGVTVRTARI